MQNRIEIEEAKEEASHSDIPEKLFNGLFKAKRENETYYLRDLDEKPLQLKDGSINAKIRRQRRLANDDKAAAEMLDDGTPKERKIIRADK